MASNKEHLIAIGAAAYDHVDMLWQEEYFELWDDHLTPLFDEWGNGESLSAEVRKPYLASKKLCMCNADTWFQEDWYEFCDEVFALLLAVANEEGWTGELPGMFPEVYKLA